MPATTPGRAANIPAPASGQGSTRAVGTSFSRPARSSQGSAALAALFDIDENEPTYHGAADMGLAEPAPKPAPPKFNRQRFDQSVDDVLAMPEISRLLDQHEHGPEQGTGLPVFDDPAAGEASSTGPFRRMVQGFVAVFSGIVGLADGLLEGLLSRGQAAAEPVRTPGDRKVTEWRLEQLRRARRRMTPAKALGWAMLWSTLGVLLWSGLFLRDTIAGAWPQAEAAYARFGLIAPPQPLEIATIDHRFARSTGGNVVELAGTLAHRGTEPARAPLFRADALSPSGEILSSWAFTLNGVRSLTPQSETPFRTRALTPPGTAGVKVSLLDARERAELERTMPGLVTAFEAPGAGSGTGTNAFFMRKTTGGWGAGDEPQPIDQTDQGSLRD